MMTAFTGHAGEAMMMVWEAKDGLHSFKRTSGNPKSRCIAEFEASYEDLTEPYQVYNIEIFHKFITDLFYNRI